MTPPRKGIVRAGAYTRQSITKDDRTNLDDQDRRCDEVAEQLGWTIVDCYRDPNRSAWKRNGKRPDWDRLMADVHAGKVDAIISYWGDRLTRKGREGEDLLDLVEDQGLRLATTEGGEQDLVSENGEFMFRLKVDLGAQESRRISRRITEMHERRQHRGKPRLGGRYGRAYGFEADGETHVSLEAAVIEDRAREILNGKSLSLAATELNEAGYPTVGGAQWTGGSLKRVLIAPRNAGLFADGVTPGGWPPILDLETWLALRAEIVGRTRDEKKRPAGRRWLLTGIATCGSCKQTVDIRHHGRSKDLVSYGCRNKTCRYKVTRNVEMVDEFVIEFLLAKLRDLKLVDVGVDESLIVKLDTLERARDAAATDMVNLDEVTAATIRRVTLPEYARKIEQVSAQIAEQRATHVLAEVAGISRAEWDRLPLAKRRAIMRQAVAVEIHPAVRGRKEFDPESVLVRKRSALGS